MKKPTATHDAWLAQLAPLQRAALEKLRAQIHAAAPGATETFSYGLPTFTRGKHLVAFGAFKNHLSLFPMSARLISALPEAAPFATSKGTLQFQPEKPIPAALVKKIVKARIAEEEGRAAARAAKKKAPRAKK
jgi:uncharacterized protein YdhG (YjbR/CyaY superfamily)